jgi:DNA-binding GntR family transcriptional regulator
MTTKTTEHKTSNHYAYASMRNAILDGRFLPGTSLREQGLVDQLKISRTPIREALQRLAAEGLVEIIPHRGATVLIPKPEDVREEYMLRAALEGFAMGLVAQNITDEDLQKLQGMADEMEGLLDQGNMQKFLRANREFHIEVYSISGCSRIVALIDASWQKDDLYRRFFYAQPAGLETEKAKHRELLQACRLRDPDLARKITEAACYEGMSFIIKASQQFIG